MQKNVCALQVYDRAARVRDRILDPWISYNY